MEHLRQRRRGGRDFFSKQKVTNAGGIYKAIERVEGKVDVPQGPANEPMNDARMLEMNDMRKVIAALTLLAVLLTSTFAFARVAPRVALGVATGNTAAAAEDKAEDKAYNKAERRCDRRDGDVIIDRYDTHVTPGDNVGIYLAESTLIYNCTTD